MFRVPEGDCCLLCVSILAEDRVISSVLSNLSVLRETQSHSRLPGKRGTPQFGPGPPGHPARPSVRLGPAGRAGGAARPPTFSWALLNFFCTCLANRPAAPPALPSAILPAPGAWPGGLWFSGGPRGGSAVPSMPRIRPWPWPPRPTPLATPAAAQAPREAPSARSHHGPEASGATSAQPRPPRGTPGAQAGLPLFGGGGWTLGPALRGCSFKSSVEAAHPAGRGAPAPRNRVFESGPRPIRARRQFAITISTGKELERWGRKIAISA